MPTGFPVKTRRHSLGEVSSLDPPAGLAFHVIGREATQPSRSTAGRGGGLLEGARSAAARRIICHAPEIPRPAMAKATTRSGQPVLVPKTPAAASRTARLPITSLREQSQTDCMFASPVLKP